MTKSMWSSDRLEPAEATDTSEELDRARGLMPGRLAPRERYEDDDLRERPSVAIAASSSCSASEPFPPCLWAPGIRMRWRGKCRGRVCVCVVQTCCRDEALVAQGEAPIRGWCRSPQNVERQGACWRGWCDVCVCVCVCVCIGWRCVLSL